MKTLSSIVSLFIICVGSENFTTVLDYPDKEALRYGFQKTADCKSFEKSFLCVRKCLDLGYDIAVADKNCKCSCYSKKDKAKYSSNSPSEEKWKSGAPTTKLPLWAQTTKSKTRIVEEDLNASGFTDENDNGNEANASNDATIDGNNTLSGNDTINDANSSNDTSTDEAPVTTDAPEE